jgi:hypothetical protein
MVVYEHHLASWAPPTLKHHRLTLVAVFALFSMSTILSETAAFTPGGSPVPSIYENFTGASVSSTTPGVLNSLNLPTFVLVLFQSGSYSLASTANLLALVKFATLSLCSTQGQYSLLIAVPENQRSFYDRALPSQRKISMISYDKKLEKCWVAYKNRAVSNLLEQHIFGLKNVIFFEADQIFFRPFMSSMPKVQHDISFTFTSKWPVANLQRACLNSGIIYIKDVTQNVVNFFRDVSKYTRKIYQKIRCVGGKDQSALCRATGGYIKPFSIRKIAGLEILSIPRDIFNPTKGTVACSLEEYSNKSKTNAKIVLSHFVGPQKHIMLQKRCMNEYLTKHGAGKCKGS